MKAQATADAPAAEGRRRAGHLWLQLSWTGAGIPPDVRTPARTSLGGGTR